MTDESKSLVELLNDLEPSLREVQLKIQGTEMDIINERAKTHGDYKTTAGWSQSLKDMFRSSGNWHNLNDGQREALEMIAVKLARLLNGNPQFPDHWDDISGYGKLGADSIERSPDLASLEQAIAPPSDA
jgi:hypothetical protein